MKFDNGTDIDPLRYRFFAIIYYSSNKTRYISYDHPFEYNKYICVKLQFTVDISTNNDQNGIFLAINKQE